MSSKRAMRRSACDGKIRHETLQGAASHRNGLYHRKGEQGTLDIYRCQFCGGWHIGHKSRKHRSGRTSTR